MSAPIEPRLKGNSGLYVAAWTTAAALLAWGIVLWGLGRGLDVTDEGFYLNSISQPYLYPATYTQFGFLLHPIDLLLGGDLILLRLSGVVLLTLAAAYFVSSSFRLPGVPALPGSARLPLVLGGACAVLLAYYPWIPTPNYNLLNLFGVMLVFGGWFRFLIIPEQAVLLGWRRLVAIAAFAIGFAIVALVKPTAAPVLAVGAMGLTLPFGRRALIEVIAGGALSIGLVVLALVAIDGDLPAAIQRYRNVLVLNELSETGHDVGSSLLLGAGMLLGVVVGYALGRWLMPNRDRRHLAAILALILAPLALALGTNTGILHSVPRAGIFWVVAAAHVLIFAAPSRIRLPLACLAMAICSTLVAAVIVRAVQKPYRLNGPLWAQTEWISSASRAHFVKVDPVTADYFRALLTGAKAAGFKRGTPVIDLSGMGPTSIYVLGGAAIGLPWINGGYSGSQGLAVYVLSTIPRAELRRAWILTSPGGHGYLPTDILTDLGLKFPDDYEEVARGTTTYMNATHLLWRPHN
ncbi:hypothetical protein FXB41_13905 [Bradyrhizobium canariense]|uniref:hypothetical protein n=1 Tax=Bradyrhizobium canariense TaxID=255045 RepID=UPI001CA5653A|nr:hypothetical protein [Bradyrhizobium canariense]MBW5435838.1 hypothetical protein [Bradyrhizobium canariense]